MARYLVVAGCLAGMAVVTPGAASAQRTPEEWVATHVRDASAQRAQPRGALPLLRLRQLREHVDPVPLAERFHALATDPAVPPARRALAMELESEVRRDLGDLHAATETLHPLGFLTRWMVLGPFANEGRGGFARVMVPEVERREAPDPTRTYDGVERAVRWRPFPDIATVGYVSLDAVVRPSVNVCAFAHTTVTAPADEPAVLWLGAAGAVTAWVNNARVYSDEAVRRGFPDRAGVAVRLHRGANRVLLKLCTDDHGMGFYARFTRPDGSPRADLEADADPSHAPAMDVPADPVDAGHMPAVQGYLEELRRAATGGNDAQRTEDYARALSLTGSDDPAAPQSADLAERAARGAPTAARWLLLADLTTDRNRRLQALQRAYALAPEDPHVLAGMGHERRLGAWPGECVPYLEAAMRLDPGYVLPRVEHAIYLDGEGFPLAARAELDAAAALAPRSAAVLRTRVAVAEHGQQGEAAEALERALLRVRYTDLEVHGALAADARQRGDRATVRQEAERVLAIKPDQLAVYTQSAEWLEWAGEGELAVGTLSRAVEIAPDEPGLWRARGELEARLGMSDAARVSLRRAIALRPQDTVTRQHLEALEPAVPRPDEALAEAPAVFLPRRQETATGDYNLRTLQDLTVRTVYPNGLSGTFRQVAYQVTSEQGARVGRAYSMQYEPDAQRFELRAARVHHADGTVDESAQVENFSLGSDPSGRMFSNNQLVQVSFSRLQRGDVVEVRWRVDDTAARNNFGEYFGDLQVVQEGVPRAHWAYVLRAPTARQLYFHVSPLARLVRTEAVDGATTVYGFTATDVPAIAPEEHAPGLTERAAYVHVSTYRTWEEVARWYWGLVRDQQVADDHLRGVVRELTAHRTDPREKVRAIYDWVLAHTRYVALEFGIHGFQPYPVPQVCMRGFGDCKDKASVIVTMLREAGIDADMVLLRTRANGAVETSPASLAVFDHAIAYVPSLDLFLDGTAQHSGMDELPGGDQGVMALRVDNHGVGRLVQTPVTTADLNVNEIHGELALTAAGGASLTVTQEVRGPNAGGVRSLLEAQATRAERVEEALRENYPGAHVTAVRTNDLTDNEHPARLSYDATVPVVGTRQGGTLIVNAATPLNLTRQYGTRSSRTADLVVGVPSTRDETGTVRLPPGATVAELPPAAHLESPFGRMDFTVEAHGGTLTVRRVLVLSRDRILPSDYPAFRTFCAAVDDVLAHRVTLHVPEESVAR